MGMQHAHGIRSKRSDHEPMHMEGQGSEVPLSRRRCCHRRPLMVSHVQAD